MFRLSHYNDLRCLIAVWFQENWIHCLLGFDTAGKGLNSLSPSNFASLTFGLPLVAVAVMGAMLIYVFFVRDRRKVAITAGGVSREQLVAEIAALDKRHDAGEVEEDEYAGQRQELFDQALGAEPASEDLPAGESEESDSGSR